MLSIEKLFCMSKILAIVRHGKSTWEFGSIADFDRPLKEVGINNSIAVSQKLVEKKYVPSLIISSPAIRALHTAMIFAREMHYPVDQVCINNSLYSETEDEVMDMIRSTAEDISCLFIFGHNPTSIYIANNFLNHKIDNLPTSGVVLFEFKVDHWKDISRKVLIHEQCIIPKQINL